MSGSLFQLFYGDDVAGATAVLSRDGLQTGPTAIAPTRDTAGGTKLSKQDINKRDGQGRTVLHLAASKGSFDFVKALLQNPATDINLLDTESGWSALHRALYNGRIACAQYVIATRGRDTIKAKDRESNSPFDVLNSTLNGTNPPPLYDSKGGSDLFTFGSNKNNSLGFGDGDDRSHPEKVQVIRPTRKDETPMSMFRPTRICDVQMAKMHTAIITTDARDNLYMCGFNGTSGRLGLSDQSSGTQFLPKPVHGISDPVASVALGQDHTIAVTKTGAVYTWGSNQHGQLGYPLDLTVNKDNVQKVPRKIISNLKRVDVLGVAASGLHSVCFSEEDLYTWGLNRGQLGYSSGDDGPIQSTPKKVATLLAPVEMVTAIDNATICLLKTKVVQIFANGGHFRVTFPLDRFADNFAGVSLSSVFRPRQMYAPNIITKVTSGGTTICAVSSMGDVFSFSLPPDPNLRPSDLAKQIKATRIWSLRRRHMAVRDVAVGQDGTVIISTESGSVWTRVKRAKVKMQGGMGKEFKFARVGSLTRIVAVRANSAGAYAAIRNDVELQDVEIERESLGRDLIRAIPLGEVVEELSGEKDTSSEESDSDESVEDVPKENGHRQRPWTELFSDLSPPSDSCDVALVTRDGHRLYAHKAMIACRSPTFREFLKHSTPTIFKVNTIDGILEMQIDANVVATAQLIYYIYADTLLDLPVEPEKAILKLEREVMVRQLRTLASKFQLKHLSDLLSSSWNFAITPFQKSLQKDLQTLQTMSSILAPTDAILCLSDREVRCHSFVLAVRCPFFEAMLDNAGLGGGWLASRRREALAGGTSEFRVQLKHLSYNIMSLVLEHIYSDAGLELFDHIRKATVDEFLEFVIEVMAVANELLLDRLKDICQSILSRFVTLRNVATILEEADTYAAEQLKDSCLDYCAINAEALLENRLLDDLDPDIMSDLEVRVREKQVERLPISRGEILLHDLAARYPNLVDDILQEHEARQFTSVLGTSLASSHGASSLPSTPVDPKHANTKGSLGRRTRRSVTPVANSPVLRPTSDLIFDMDDDLDMGSPSVKPGRPHAPTNANPWRDVSGKPLKEQPPAFSANQQFRLVPESVAADVNGHKAWSEVKTPSKGYDLSGTMAKTRKRDMNTRVSAVPQPTPSRPSPQNRPGSEIPSPVIPLSSPSLSTPGISPWKKQDMSPPIAFTSLQKEQASPTLSSTFPPSTQTSIPKRPTPPTKPATRPPLPPSTSTDSTVPRRNSATTATASTTPTQIRSVPGKSFQQKTPAAPQQSPRIAQDAFPVLGSSPQNLADIIAQQTSEQKALTAKATPRSLKEIQEEEKFLQWWEQESQRVKEEEVAARIAEMSMRGRGRGQRGRGGEGRGRGGTRGRGDGKARGRGEFMRGDFGRGHVHNNNRGKI